MEENIEQCRAKILQLEAEVERLRLLIDSPVERIDNPRRMDWGHYQIQMVRQDYFAMQILPYNQKHRVCETAKFLADKLDAALEKKTKQPTATDGMPEMPKENGYVNSSDGSHYGMYEISKLQRWGDACFLAGLNRKDVG